MFKKYLNKFISTIGFVCALSLGFLMYAYAGTAGIYFSDPEITLGTDVYVTMKITSEDGTNLQDADVVLNYPVERLEFISGTDADGGAGAIRVHGASNGAGTTELEYSLGFRTLEAGTASISISSYEVYDTLDEPVDIIHQGSSSVSVDGGEAASSDSSLSTLEISPGELSPAFSPDITGYSVTVGTSVDSLSINANPQDTGASVTIQNNSDFQMGDNTVLISVTAADGVTSRVYTIVVSKVEGGPEVDINEASTSTATGENGVVEGVELYSRGKTITVISPDESVEVPQGFRSGIIRIDEERVEGWIPDATDDPEYCILYGLNEDGEANFYRYDMQEKTIQRYFSDPSMENSVSSEEYDALLSTYEDLLNQSGIRLIIIVILAAIAVILSIFCAYLLTKNRSLLKSGKLIHFSPGEKVKRPKNRTDNENDEGESKQDGLLDEILLGLDNQSYDYKPESNLDIDSTKSDETQVIVRSRKRRRGRVVDERQVDESKKMIDENQTDESRKHEDGYFDHSGEATSTNTSISSDTDGVSSLNNE